MTSASDLTGMYKSFPLYLWVEDEETRVYLQTVWTAASATEPIPAPQIGIYVAGGHEHLEAIVHAARNQLNNHVLGFRDRDFTQSNRSRWTDMKTIVLRSEAFELENLLLDSEAIADCDVNTSGMGPAQIERRLHDLAQPLLWWMSCRQTITELRTAVTGTFLGHPKHTSICTEAAALKAIVESSWWTSTLPALHPTWGSKKDIRQKLSDYEADYRRALDDGSWKRVFSGKEIFRALRCQVWTKKQKKDPEGLIEFVRAIASAQCRLGRVPNEVLALRSALLQRITPPPSESPS